MELSVLHSGGKGEQARAFQSAMNRRLQSRGLAKLRVAEDGDVGPATLRAARTCAWVLGAAPATLKRIRDEHVVPIGVSAMVRNPGRRSDAQRERGCARMANMRAQRKRRVAEAAKEGSRTKACNAFLAKVGTTEQPPGSNSGGLITVMETYWGFGRVPWCGISAGYHAERYGGCDLQSDVASVAAIERHATNGTGNYGQWRHSVIGCLPGSFVVIGGSGVHVGMLLKAYADGSADTVEGNTSFGPGGSQSNGGCIAKRHRSDAEIFGVATMNYP